MLYNYNIYIVWKEEKSEKYHYYFCLDINTLNPQCCVGDVSMTFVPINYISDINPACYRHLLTSAK